MSDNSGNYVPYPFYENPGPIEVSCQAFCEADGMGAASPLETISFSVERADDVPAPTAAPLDCSTCKEGCFDVVAFHLVDAETDTYIRPLVEGETLTVTATDSLAIECITSPDGFATEPFIVGSTLLTDNKVTPRNSEVRCVRGNLSLPILLYANETPCIFCLYRTILRGYLPMTVLGTISLRLCTTILVNGS